MNFEWIVPGFFKDLAEEEYINPCCIGGDKVLNLIKSEIARLMNIGENSIEIYQEDWGWALEFQKGKVLYLLAINNASESENSEMLFLGYSEATRKEKGFFFDKTVDASDELKYFSEIIAKIARKKRFEIKEK